MLIWCPTVDSQHLSKSDKRDGWLDDRHGLSPILYAVMSTSHVCRVTSRVTIPSSQSRVIGIFFESSQSRVMTWSSRVRVESQNLSSHFESLVCQPESMSSQMKLNIVIIILFKYFFIFFVLWRKMKWQFLFFQMKFCFCKTSLCQMQLNIVRKTLTSRSLNIMRSEFLKQKKS